MGRSDNDYQEELREHIAMETQANIDRGMSPEDAARAARITFGSVTGTRQQLNEGRPAYWRETLAQDFRYALRTIRRNLLLSCTVVLTLSLGLGFTTAVFSVINALAFNPPVSVDPDSFALVLNNGSHTQRRVISVPEYERLRTQAQSFRELAVWSEVFKLSAPLGSMDTRKVEGWLTSCNFFSVFSDDRPRLGRFFHEDDCSKTSPVIVISERVWRERFAADPDIVGKPVSYGGRPLTVIGVAVPPKLVDESAPGLWIPYPLQPSVKELSAFPMRDWLEEESNQWLQMAGRLQPGTSHDAAAAELKVLMSRKAPTVNGRHVDIRLTDGSIWTMFPTDVLGLFALALAFPTLVMAIVCATVATLLLSRAVARQREMAVRLALGGGRRRLIQMLLAETFLLAFAAGIGSLVIVYQLPAVLIRFMSAASAPPIAASPDWRVFLYMSLTTILTAVLSGLTPALESLNTQIGESLKGREVFGKRRGRSFMRHSLVGVQVAFTVVLLVTAGTLVRAERRQSSPGFETRQVLSVDLPRSLAQDSSGAQASLAATLQALPGVRSVAFSNSLPAIFERDVELDIPGNPAETFLSADVSPDYFRTFEIPILSGQNFMDAESSEGAGSEPVVVSEQFARRLFPQQSPLGQTLEVSNSDRRFQIIGVARNRSAEGRRQAYNDGSFIYQRMKPQEDTYLFVRFDGNPLQVSRALQSVLKAQTGTVLSVTTIQAYLDERMAPFRSLELLVLGLGVVGLSLALIGVYGVVSFAAAQRKREFAIRIALGARRPSVFATVVAAGMRPIPVAILAGLALSFGTSKMLSVQGLLLLGTDSGDPIPYIAAVILLLFAILVALAFPAYRAMSSDPVDALREE